MSAILTLKQLQQTTHAFDSFTTVANSSLPEYYKGIFPQHCRCGGEVILTDVTDEQGGNTQLQCCNPDCWIKMAHRFAYFAKALGYKGFGATGALTLYEAVHSEFKYPTFLSIFFLPLSTIMTYMGEAYANGFDTLRAELSSRSFQFKDAISSLGIPGVGKGSTLFDIVKDPVVLLNACVKNSVSDLCDMAGIHAPKTRYYLNIARLDILILLRYVMPHILSTPKREVYISITGAVMVDGVGLTRAEFISKCESLQDSNGTQAYKLVETKAVSKLDYVIADSPSSSSKYELGKRLNRLITADDFYHMLEKNVEGSARSESR